MATTKDIVYLQERIEQEENKLRILEERRTDPNREPQYRARGKTIDVLVPSFQKPNSLYYIVRVVERSLEIVTGTSDAAGLAKIGCLPINANINNAKKVRNKYATTKYPRILIVQGAGTVTKQRTDWGTNWLKDYDKASDGQSHRLLPFGFDTTLSTTASFDNVYEFFLAQFKQSDPAGPLAQSMGANGTASLIVGKDSVIASFKNG